MPAPLALVSVGPPEARMGFRWGRRLGALSAAVLYEGAREEDDAPALLEWLPRDAPRYEYEVGALYEAAQIAARLDSAWALPLWHAEEDAAGCLLAYGWPAGDRLSGITRRLSARGQALPFGLGVGLIATAARGLEAIVGLEGRRGDRLGVEVGAFFPEALTVDPDGAPRWITPALRLGTTEAASRAHLTDASAAYVAPECLLGAPWTPRAVVYGLGVMLYELLAGRPAYPGGRSEEIPARALRGGPSRSALAEEGVPNALRRLVEAALDRSEIARPEGPGALAAALQGWLQSAGHVWSPRLLAAFLDHHELRGEDEAPLGDGDDAFDATLRGASEAAPAGPAARPSLSVVPDAPARAADEEGPTLVDTRAPASEDAPTTPGQPIVAPPVVRRGPPPPPPRGRSASDPLEPAGPTRPAPCPVSTRAAPERAPSFVLVGPIGRLLSMGLVVGWLLLGATVVLAGYAAVRLAADAKKPPMVPGLVDLEE